MKNFRGYIVIQALVFGGIGVLLIGALAGWAKVSIVGARQLTDRERAFQIAEAGVEYYRWHLAHAATDYQDGTGGPGPHVHDYEDKNGEVVGSFTLTITPPPIGSTVVTILSEGRVLSNPAAVRKIEAKLAIPSIAKYAFVANSVMRFGSGTEIFGPIHSNDGIRFDGLAHNLVTSSRADYDDTDHNGLNEFAVHTHVKPPPQTGLYPDSSGSVPAEMPPPPTAVRNDVFLAGRQFPVPAVDFAGFTNDMATMKTDAQTGGFYRGASGGNGYRVVLRTDDTFDLYRVNSLRNPPGGCSTSGQTGWGTWSINTTGGSQTNLGRQSLPANGLIFLEDHVWVEGQINSARITIASARFPENPSTYTSMIVNNDIRYTNYDGQDVLALISQNNINIGLYSEDDLRIDAALVAKNGRVGRYYYGSSCSSYYLRSVITLFGMLGTNQRYGFSWICGGGSYCSGYNLRNINYDANLLYGPPPSFPLTSDQYSTISWREVP